MTGITSSLVSDSGLFIFSWPMGFHLWGSICAKKVDAFVQYVELANVNNQLELFLKTRLFK